MAEGGGKRRQEAVCGLVIGEWRLGCRWEAVGWILRA